MRLGEPEKATPPALFALPGPDVDDAAIKVQVVQLQREGLAEAQAARVQQRQKCPVAKPGRGSLRAHANQALDLVL